MLFWTAGSPQVQGLSGGEQSSPAGALCSLHVGCRTSSTEKLCSEFLEYRFTEVS